MAGGTRSRTGKGVDAWTSGFEGAWTQEPTTWDNGFLDNLFKYDWELTTSPDGKKQWTATDSAAQGTVPDAHDPSKGHSPMMLTTDLALRLDPIYAPISKRFHENPDQLADAFAKAWYKLIHRDMGPVSRLSGPVGSRAAAVAGPGPPRRSRADRRGGHRCPQGQSPGVGTVGLPAGLHSLGAAASFRGTDKRAAPTGHGFASRRRRTGRSTTRPRSREVLQTLEEVQQDFNRSQPGEKRVSLADLIVLGGCAAVEQAAKNAGPRRARSRSRRGAPTRPRTRPTSESFAVLEPTSDGFRNYLRVGEKLPPEHLLVERANLLTLTAPEMTVLVGGMRALNANFGQSDHGVFTGRPETLTNDFFVNLLDMGTEWKVSTSAENVYEGRDRTTGEIKWTATAVDLVFGSNSQLRALSEVYACDDSKEKFVRDFVTAWDKVMNLDRFDLA